MRECDVCEAAAVLLSAAAVIAGQMLGTGNQAQVFPDNTRDNTRPWVMPVFEVPDGQRQPSDHTAAAARARGGDDPMFFVMPIAIAYDPRRRVRKHRAEL